MAGIDPLARVLMALLFLVSGGGKLAAVTATQAYMAAFGVPGVLVWPAALFEIGSGCLLVAGLWIRPLGLLLAGWCILTAVIFHIAWSDPVMLMMFFKNVTMAGSFLLLAKTGAPGFSLGRRLVKQTGSWAH